MLPVASRRVALALVLALTGCALPVNGIAKGRAPRIQAAVILLGAALEASIAVSAARQAQRGEIVCRPKPDAGDGSLSPKSDCTTPFEFKIAAAMFGLTGGFDTGVAIYQLVTGKPMMPPPHKPQIDPDDIPAYRRTSPATVPSADRATMTAPAAQR